MSDPICLSKVYIVLEKVFRSYRVDMTLISSYNGYALVLSVLFFVSSNLLYGADGAGKQSPAKKLDVIHHEICESYNSENLKTLKDVHTYSQLKYDPRASLPSSFTICVSVLVTIDNLRPSLFTLLGNDGQPWFSAQIRPDLKGNFAGRQFFYPVQNQFAKVETMRAFPNQWVRSCLALNTESGLVQWVAEGELMDKNTFAGITNNVPTNLSDKVVLGSYYLRAWHPSSNKFTKLEIFSSALDVKTMMEYTKGEGCGDDGDYLSWNEMQWSLHGE